MNDATKNHRSSFLDKYSWLDLDTLPSTMSADLVKLYHGLVLGSEGEEGPVVGKEGSENDVVSLGVCEEWKAVVGKETGEERLPN